MTTKSQDVKNNFLVQAQRKAGMKFLEAQAVADFISGIGEVLLEQLIPIMEDYQRRIRNEIRSSVIEELITDFNSSNGFAWSRTAVLSKIKSHDLKRT